MPDTVGTQAARSIQAKSVDAGRSRQRPYVGNTWSILPLTNGGGMLYSPSLSWARGVVVNISACHVEDRGFEPRRARQNERRC